MGELLLFPPEETASGILPLLILHLAGKGHSGIPKNTEFCAKTARCIL
jgi:hypothetical protein